MAHSDTLTDKQGNKVQVLDQPDFHRFIIVYPDDQQVAGFTMYVDNGGERLFWHTLVDDTFEGRGLATILVAHAMEEVAKTDQVVVPTCPFVHHYLEKHGENIQWREPTKQDIAWLIENADGAREVLA